MGYPKALLPVPPHGRPLLATIVQRLAGLQPYEVVVVANDPRLRQQLVLERAARWISDRYGSVGPLGGIATALAASVGWALVVACDMPLLNPDLLQYLIHIAEETDAAGESRWDAVVPVVAGYPEPLHALYHRRCLPAVEARLANSERKATAFLADVRVRYVNEEELRLYDPTLHSFLNANTPAEWQAICALLTE